MNRNLPRLAARCVAAACLSIALSAGVSGQQAAGGIESRQYLNAERGATIDQLVAAALERSPAVLAARARIEVARGHRMQAALRPNPSLTTDLREEIGGMDRQAMVGVMWPLDLFGRPGRVAAAEQRVAIAEQEAAEVERALAAGVRTKALQLLSALRQLAVRQRVASTLGQFRDLVAARAQSGAIPALDRDVADVDARRADAEVPRQRAAVDSALADLRGLIGWPANQPLLLRHDLEQIAAGDEGIARRAGDVTAEVREWLRQRPDIRLAEAQVGAAMADVDLVRREARPDVSIGAAYMRMNSGFPLFGLNGAGVPSPIENASHNLSIGATITLPWRDRRQGDLAAATARAEAAKFELESRRLGATAELEAAQSRVRGLDTALAIYTGGLRELAAKNVDVVRQSYQLGRATLMDVLSETRRLLDTETAYTEVLLDALQARSDLATAMGVIR